jgi:hypothetical protein
MEPHEGRSCFLLELGYTVLTFVEWGKLVRIIWEFWKGEI